MFILYFIFSIIVPVAIIALIIYGIFTLISYLIGKGSKGKNEDLGKIKYNTADTKIEAPETSESKPTTKTTKKSGGIMKQQFIKREVADRSISKRGLENKVLTVMNDLVEEVNATGGRVEKYEILNSERWGKNISIIFLVTWD